MRRVGARRPRRWTADSSTTATTVRGKPRGTLPGKSWWWVQDDRYVVAFSPVAGYVELARFGVERWLPRTPVQIYLLERTP